MDPEGPPAELVAVHDDVVRVGERVPGILVEAVAPLVGRPGERVVDRSPPALLVVPAEHREIRDPEKRERVVVDQPELPPEMQAEVPEDT